MASCAFRRRVTLLCSLLFAASAGAQTLPAHVPVLVLQQAEGAELLRDSALLPSADGVALREGDSLTAKQPLALQLHRYGHLRLGTGARMRVEQLPFSSYARDLGTVLDLQAGYLHVLWKRPDSSDSWPLEVVFGERRLNLDSGEYFFEIAETPPRVCIAGGALSWLEQGNVQRLQAPGCYPFDASGAGPRQRQSGADFIALRERMRLSDAVLAAPLVMPPRTPVASTRAPAAVPAPAQALAPVSLPVPVLAPPVAAPQGGGWTLQVSSMPDLASAQHALQRLQAAGHAAVMVEADARGRHWYRVQLRGLPDAAQARALGQRIERELGYSGSWVVAE